MSEDPMASQAPTHDPGTNEGPSGSPGGTKKSIVSVKPSVYGAKEPNFFIRSFRSVFGYRKTSLSLFVICTFIVTIALSKIDNDLLMTVSLPESKLEQNVLQLSWSDLQHIGEFKHPYGSDGNKYVHDYLQSRIVLMVEDSNKPYIEFDNDYNNTNAILYTRGGHQYSYYESNNLMVKINGSRSDLPGLLISSHYDSVPSSYGVTDDGMGIASLLGVLNYYTSKSTSQPARTLVLNFNNNEEFGLHGAQAFLNHTWADSVKYFINLEGTGNGGKAMLFRGTDYGITKEYSNVRFPYATSIFQQAFNSRLIHSETDYRVYYQEAGLRGIDIAFYKPRDIYHTGLDNIRYDNIKSLWHMLSNALDFVEAMAIQEIDADGDYIAEESPKIGYASYASFLNFFFIISLPSLIALNICLVVIIPVVSMAFLIIIFGYKKNWKLGFINSVKYPVSLVISVILLSILNRQVVGTINEFLPNSSPMNITLVLFSCFLLFNYLLLNGINFLFKRNKYIQHDEKLIVILQNSFIYWILLIVSTARLATNKPGNDHTGEALLTVLFIIQSIGSLFGLLGWCFKASKRELELELEDACAGAGADSRPLLSSTDDGEGYGAHDNNDLLHSTSFISTDSYTARKKLSLIKKSFSYDWSIQFLILVPISALIIYNNGYLILTGLNKSIQESMSSEVLLYKLMEIIAIVWALPFLPFIFKVNRIIFWILLIIVIQGFLTFTFKEPFDLENPMKLKFIQSANLTESFTDSFVKVNGRIGTNYEEFLKDMPSVKDLNLMVTCEEFGDDGMQQCKYNTTLFPQVLSKSSNFSDYLSVDILKGSDFNDVPFGLLTGELKLNVQDNNMCLMKFNSGKDKDIPVKTIIIYQDNELINDTDITINSIPVGFSKDKQGNFYYKDVLGITNLSLNKLDSNKPYHIGLQWVPNLIDSIDNKASNKLKVDIDCYWGNLGDNNHLVPAYHEVNHYSPNYVSWANMAGGMVSVSTSIEV